MSTQPTPASELDHRLRTLAPGWRFAGRYRMENLVGRGGMGVVWRAKDETLDRPVALKFLVETLVHDPAAIDDLKRETRRALELTHHNIVRVYDFVEDRSEGLAGIAMEFFPGQTLAARRIAVTARCFDPETVAPWVSQLCDAMAYAHEKVGVIHRDLKPQNLMIDERGELKITDFGIARVASDSLSRISIGKISGTPSYMSPQQARGESPTATDDVYAIGATIYELLTSRPPFWQGDIPSQIGTIVPPRLTDRRRELTGIATEIPQAWEETIAACLDKIPANRPRGAREIAERLGISLPTTHFPTPATSTEQASGPITAPPVDLAALQTDGLESPTLAGVTIVQSTTSIRERSPAASVPTSHPAGSEPKEPEFPIPRYLWIAGIAVTLVAIALTGGAMLRRLGPKPEPKKNPTVSVPQPLQQPHGAAFVPDKYPTIQAAIDSVQPGETITLRPGVYRENLVLKDGIRIVGEKYDACRIVPADGGTALVLARGVRQCILEILTLDGSEVADRTNRIDGIAISDAEITVSGCIIRGMTGSGIVVHGSDTAAEISANRIENNGLHGVMLLRTGSTAALRKNEIRQSKGAGIVFNEGATGLAEGNVCEQNGDSGILVAGVATAPSLQSNTCTHNENHGISFMGAARGSVTGNICNENGESGLAGIGEGTAPEFINNTARHNKRFGIYIATGADGEATGNLCEANELSGIGIAGTSTRPVLSGNQLVRNQKFGIESSNGASPRIAPDNVFTGNVAGDTSR